VAVRNSEMISYSVAVLTKEGRRSKTVSVSEIFHCVMTNWLKVSCFFETSVSYSILVFTVPYEFVAFILVEV
jgi:hypothetical protein